MKKTNKNIFSLIVLIMLLFPLILTNTEEGAVSDIDGRTLRARPVQGTGHFTSDVEEWLKDRLGLRDQIVNIHAVMNDKLFDELINPTYQYGKEGYTFFKLKSNIEYSDYHKQFAEMISNMQKYCETRGTKFYYVLNPEKERVYERYLPAGVNYSDKWADKMLADMDRLGVNYIDLRDTLTEISNDEDVFNKKYDAGHWNQTGAFYGTKAIVERIHKDVPHIRTLEKDEYDVTTTIAKKLYGSNQVFNEEMPVYTLKAGFSDITGDLASELIRSDEHPYFQLAQNDSENASGIEHMLLLEDSMYGSFAFARSKETADITCMQNAINFDYYYNIFKPDVVVFENMEYVVTDTYFSQQAMEEANWNPAVIKNYPEELFAESLDSLLEKSQKFETEAYAVVLPGVAIDKVFISRVLSEAKFSYLITDKKAIDLKASENGVLTASVRHGDLSEESDALLYYLDNKGNGHYTWIPVTSKIYSIAKQTGMTEGVAYDSKEDVYTLTTDAENNSFSCSVIQLLDSRKEKFICNFSEENSSPGRYTGYYYHNKKSGEYTVLLKANSNSADEYIEYKANLKKGNVYLYSYIVDEFSDKRVKMKDFSLFERR